VLAARGGSAGFAAGRAAGRVSDGGSRSGSSGEGGSPSSPANWFQSDEARFGGGVRGLAGSTGTSAAGSTGGAGFGRSTSGGISAPNSRANSSHFERLSCFSIFNSRNIL
jgi:hypothetical protein